MLGLIIMTAKSFLLFGNQLQSSRADHETTFGHSSCQIVRQTDSDQDARSQDQAYLNGEQLSAIYEIIQLTIKQFN